MRLFVIYGPHFGYYTPGHLQLVDDVGQSEEEMKRIAEKERYRYLGQMTVDEKNLQDLNIWSFRDLTGG